MEASFWLFCSVMHFRAMLLPLVALVGRSSSGILKLHLPQPQSLAIRWMMIVPMASVLVGVLYLLVVYVASVQATAFLLTPVSLPAMFQLRLKVIRSRFMHLLWMEMERFLFLVELKRYIFVCDAYWEFVMILQWRFLELIVVGYYRRAYSNGTQTSASAFWILFFNH